MAFHAYHEVHAWHKCCGGHRVSLPTAWPCVMILPIIAWAIACIMGPGKSTFCFPDKDRTLWPTCFSWTKKMFRAVAVSNHHPMALRMMHNSGTERHLIAYPLARNGLCDCIHSSVDLWACSPVCVLGRNGTDNRVAIGKPTVKSARALTGQVRAILTSQETK